MFFTIMLKPLLYIGKKRLRNVNRFRDIFNVGLGLCRVSWYQTFLNRFNYAEIFVKLSFYLLTNSSPVFPDLFSCFFLQKRMPDFLVLSEPIETKYPGTLYYIIDFD